jgi:hypothetical protein
MAIVKLIHASHKISELSDDRLFYRQRALVFLSDLLKNPENVTAAIDAGNFYLLSLFKKQ